MPKKNKIALILKAAYVKRLIFENRKDNMNNNNNKTSQKNLNGIGVKFRITFSKVPKKFTIHNKTFSLIILQIFLCFFFLQQLKQRSAILFLAPPIADRFCSRSLQTGVARFDHIRFSRLIVRNFSPLFLRLSLVLQVPSESVPPFSMGLYSSYR